MRKPYRNQSTDVWNLKKYKIWGEKKNYLQLLRILFNLFYLQTNFKSQVKMKFGAHFLVIPSFCNWNQLSRNQIGMRPFVYKKKKTFNRFIGSQHTCNLSDSIQRLLLKIYYLGLMSFVFLWVHILNWLVFLVFTNVALHWVLTWTLRCPMKQM